MSSPMRNPDGTMVDPNFSGYFPVRPGSGIFGGGSGGSATGEVDNITSAAGRAGRYLSTAGEAIGQGGRRSNPLYQPMKKGGKVKKKKSSTIKARGVGRAVQKKIRPAKMVKM